MELAPRIIPKNIRYDKYTTQPLEAHESLFHGLSFWFAACTEQERNKRGSQFVGTRVMN